MKKTGFSLTGTDTAAAGRAGLLIKWAAVVLCLAAGARVSAAEERPSMKEFLASLEKAPEPVKDPAQPAAATPLSVKAMLDLKRILRDEKGLALMAPFTLERRGDDTYFVYPGASYDLPSLGADARRRPEFAIERQGNAYAVVGAGRGDYADGSRRPLASPVFMVGFQEKVTARCSVGFEHANDGHPVNDPAKNHRDKFQIMGWCAQPLSDNLKAEAGVGLGATYNTVKRDGTEYDDHDLSKVLALAIQYKLGDSGWNLRAQAEYARVQDNKEFKSMVYGFGIARDLGGERSRGNRTRTGHDRVAVFGGIIIENRGGSHNTKGGEIEWELPIVNNFSAAIDAFDNGQGVYSDRQGVCGMGRYSFPAAKKWVFSAATGPCAALEKNLGNRGITPLWRVTLDAERELSKGKAIVLRMNRIWLINPKDHSADSDNFFAGFKFDTNFLK